MSTVAKLSGPAGVLAAILFAGCGRKPVEEGTSRAETVPAVPVEAGPAEEEAVRFVLRINCGSETDYEDPDGNVWRADQWFEEGQWGFEGGSSVDRPDDTDIKKTDLAPLYRTERYGLERYRITVPNGGYSVALHVAETFSGVTAVGERVYDISIEGEQVLTGFDPIEAAGGSAYTALVKTFDVEVTDGELTIEFTQKDQEPMINGIEVTSK